MADDAALTPDRLMRRATHYLARHNASTARLREVLARAIRRQAGEDGRPGEADMAALIDPVVDRLRRAGLLDDAAFARARAARLVEKGTPARAITADLAFRHGVDAAEAGLAETLAALDPEQQATRWAARRRLGPFRLRDRARKRDADIASLVRAGFAAGVARHVVDAAAEQPGTSRNEPHGATS